MLENGYIKIFRSMLDWEWYDDTNTKVLFLHLLLTVSIADSQWHGITVKRGSRVSSYEILAKETKLTVHQIRTAVKHLEMTGEVTRLKYPNYTVFMVNNYDKFQQATRQLTGRRQGDDKVATGQRQQYKKNKEEKEDNKKEYDTFAESPSLVSKKFIPPTVEEVKAYCTERKNNIDAQRFIDYYTSNGWKVGRNAMKDWKATVRRWERNQYSNGNKQPEPERNYSYDLNEYEEFALMFGINNEESG